jgi:hypothetical protein
MRVAITCDFSGQFRTPWPAARVALSCRHMARFKFRAWHPDLARMRPCYSVLQEGLSDVCCVVWRCPEGYGGHLFDPLDEDFEELLDDEPDCPLAEWYGDVIVMQATGWVDGGGRTIFEGDILEFDLLPAGSKVRGVVVFRQETASFCVNSTDDNETRYRFGAEVREARTEILGNIYENSGRLGPP